GAYGGHGVKANTFKPYLSVVEAILPQIPGVTASGASKVEFQEVNKEVMTRLERRPESLSFLRRVLVRIARALHSQSLVDLAAGNKTIKKGMFVYGDGD